MYSQVPTCLPPSDFWSAYVDWAGEGHPIPALNQGLEWCRSHRPSAEPAGTTTSTLVWGDPRLGNLVYSDDFLVTGHLGLGIGRGGPTRNGPGLVLRAGRHDGRTLRSSGAGLSGSSGSA